MSQTQGYRFGQHAGAARSFRDPSKLLKQGAHAEIVKASWKHTSTVFRPFPLIVNGVPQPYRFDAEESNFTDWIRSYRAVMGVGNPGIDFILCDPSDPSVDRSQNPYELIYAYVQVLKKSNSLPNHIFQLTQGGNNRGAALPNTSAVTLMQGALMVHNNEPKIPARGSADNDPTCILALKSQAGDDLISLLNLKREPNAPPVDPNRAAADPYSSTFVYGDVTHLQCGGFIHTIQKGAPQQGGGQGAFGGQRGGQRQQVEIGYNVSIFDRLSNGASANMGSMLPLIVSKWTPWDEILHIPSIEEQIQYLSSVLPPDLIVSALAERYRDLIPQAVMQRGGVGVPAGSAYGGPGGGGHHPQAAGAYGAPAGGGYGAPAGGGYGAPAGGGYGGGYNRPVDPGPAQGGGFGAPAQGGDYGWNNQPANGNFDPNQGGYDPNQGGYDPNQGGVDQAPVNGGGYGAPANGGGYGAPAGGGGFGAAAPTGGAAGGYGGPAAGGTYGGTGGYGAPPQQAGFGGAQPANTGMMTPNATLPPANNAPPVNTAPPGTVNAQTAIEQARRQAAAGTQPPVMPNQQPGQPAAGR